MSLFGSLNYKTNVTVQYKKVKIAQIIYKSLRHSPLLRASVTNFSYKRHNEIAQNTLVYKSFGTRQKRIAALNEFSVSCEECREISKDRKQVRACLFSTTIDRNLQPGQNTKEQLLQ